MDRLHITAHLRGPIVLNNPTTLDALLAAGIFDQTGDLEQAHHDLPLARTSGIYHASRAMFEPLSTERAAIVQSMRPNDQWLDHNLIKKNKQGRVHLAFSNCVDNVMNPVTRYFTDQIDWYAEGDADSIRELLNGITHIGKKRATLVTRWDIEEGELDGVMGYADEPLRPVPVGVWRGEKTFVIKDCAARPAYWNPANREACYV